MTSQLIYLASNAALGISNHIQFRADDEAYGWIEGLRKYLEEGVNERGKNGELHGNPTETLIMWESLGKKQRYSEEVAVQTDLFSKDLGNLKSLSLERLAEFRDLCVELSKTAMRYEDSYIRRLAA